MAVLTDTNIFLRLLQPHHPHCRVAERALDLLRARSEELNVTSQNLIEFWAVATRPFSENGLGLGTDEAARELDQIKRLWRYRTFRSRTNGSASFDCTEYQARIRTTPVLSPRCMCMEFNLS